jgi:O-antigen/teichoic acid export membrane protein
LAGVLLKRGRPGLASAFGGAALALNVILNLFLLPAVGVVGASIASSIAYVFLAGAYVAVTRSPGAARAADLIPRRGDLAIMKNALGRSSRGAPA